ncbi:tyrosine-type recombinase/integrase [Petroclostridium sp. X23]|uniref:tyrosine-type recombinase/integrase n=1 Tax=Petroclostridium sp. X23 TaxID=3045146 RepID=UPI0024ADF0D3|nr:tyrosine-type recombinase/integrase [Petroclostridium sp. X23]WHH58498.1 tyrosine-type recombinase/integrase [Petroclostridium sp. X23]
MSKKKKKDKKGFKIVQNTEKVHESNSKLIEKYIGLRWTNGLTNKSLKALEGELNLFARYLKQHKDNKHFSGIIHTDVEDFLQCCALGRLSGKKNGAEALNRKHAALNTFYSIMIKKEYLDMKNPLDKVDKIKTRKKLRGHLEKWEVEKLIAYCEKKNDLRGAAWITLAFYSGCRLSELYQLNRKSLDFEKRRFIVCGKGDKERECSFWIEAKERILAYLDTRNDDREPLFLSSQGNRWSPKAIQDFVKNTGVRAGIETNVHPHIFRHSLAMFMLSKGIPLEVIQIQLGHENINTTQVYAHQSLRDIQSKVDKIFEADKKVG